MRCRKLPAEPYRLGRALPLALFVLVSSSCRQDMHDQPRHEPLESSAFFADGSSARAPVDGTVARGTQTDDVVFTTGRNAEDQFASTLPLPLTRALLDRGRSRFNAFCTPCHGRLGDGSGMVVQRGFKQPKSFHEQRLVESPVGYFFGVMTNGFGQMSSYAPQIDPADRWAIAAYVKALQLSRRVTVDTLTPAELQELEAVSTRSDDGAEDHAR